MGDILHFRQDRDPVPEREPETSWHEPEPLHEPESAWREPLWREALGGSLRAAREERGDRLVDVAERAGISPQYLSEIERGRKEPSSEMIAAVTGALGVSLDDLLIGIAGNVRRLRLAPPAVRRRPTGPVLLAA